MTKTLTILAVDQLLARLRTELLPYCLDAAEPVSANPGATSTDPANAAGSGITIERVTALPDGFEHRWPDRTFDVLYRATAQVDTAAYDVRDELGLWAMVVGAEQGGRRSHGRDGRGRIVVFVDHKPGSLHLYPLVEFAETDDPAPNGTPRYAAGVLRPDAPRSLATLAHVDDLRHVPHLRAAHLAQAQDVYHEVQRGPSLRLVVPGDDIETMLAHALWAGRLRGANRLPRPRP